MVRVILLFLVLAYAPSLFAQEVVRVKVSGKVHVPEDNDPEGISVYNISSQKGVITNAEGEFEIAVAENDRLQIFALQYQTFTATVDKEVLERKQMNIYVNSAINQLSEVILKPTDLTGVVQIDVKNIPTYVVKQDWDLSFKAMEFGYGFVVDSQSSIRGNLAQELLNPHTLRNGINGVNVISGLISAFLPEKKPKINVKQRIDTKTDESLLLQRKFDREYVKEFFDIPTDKAFDFLYYAQEQGLDKNLLEEGNEFQLIVYLQKKAKDYKMLYE